MRGAARTWRYLLPAVQGDGWSVVFLDSGGTMAVVVAGGSFGYRWNQSGEEQSFRRFLLDCDASYLANKIGSESDRTWFDGDRTEESIRGHICRLRRQRSIGRSAAASEWAHVPPSPTLLEFSDWVNSSKLEAAYELGVYDASPGLMHWCTVTFGRLKEVLRAELAAEAIEGGAPTAR